MNLGLPDKDPNKDNNKDVKVDENRTMTILLGDNNKLVRYVGLLATPVAGLQKTLRMVRTVSEANC
jgi:hypothetical protein